MTLRIATATRSVMADVAGALVDGGSGAGTIKVYSGAQPATPETAASGTLLATFTLADPAFAAAATGVKAINGTPLATTGAADGTAGWFRCADSTGAVVLDGACGTSGAQLNLSSVSITTGGDVSITSGSITQPAS